MDKTTERHVLLLVSLYILSRLLMVVLVSQVHVDNVAHIIGISRYDLRHNWRVYNTSFDKLPLLEKFGYSWDSIWYVEIARNGYRLPPGYTSFPGVVTPPGLDPSCNLFYFLFMYPLSIWFFSVLMGYLPAGLFVSNASFIIAIVLFYKIALNYLDSKSALRAAVLFTLFPYNLNVMTSYSEPLYLVFVLLSWDFFLKGRLFLTGVFAMLASLTRYPGAVLFPVLLLIVVKNNLGTNGWRNTFSKLILLSIFCIPIIYWDYVEIPMRTGYTKIELASITWGFTVFPGIGLVGASAIGVFFFYFAFLAAYYLKDINADLMIYSISFLIFHSSLYGFGASIGRYMGVIWPVFIYYGRKLDLMDVWVFSGIFLLLGGLLIELSTNMVTFV